MGVAPATESEKLLILGSVAFLTAQTLLVWCSMGGDLAPMCVNLAYTLHGYSMCW